MRAKQWILFSVNNAIWLAVALCLGYLWIDRSISVTYANASIDSLVDQVDVSHRILGEVLRGKSRDEIRALVVDLNQQRGQRNALDVKDDGDQLWIGQTCMQFSGLQFESMDCVHLPAYRLPIKD
jgi:hypothetical protein